MSEWAISILAIVTGSVLGGLGWLVRWLLTRTDPAPEGEGAGALSISQAYSLATGSLATEVARLTTRADSQDKRILDLETNDERKDARIRELEQQRRDDQAKIVRLEREVERLSAIESMLPRAHRYIRQLIAALRAVGAKVPEAPAGLGLQDLI